MRLTVLERRLPLSLLLICASAAWGQEDFLAGHEAGLQCNPPGVKLILRTRNRGATYHLFEPIPIDLQFSSEKPFAYTIELDEMMNLAGKSDTFQVDARSTVLLAPKSTTFKGFICCGSYRRYLSAQPTSLQRELTDYLRFEQPGTYSMYLTTRRIFHGMQKANHPDESDLSLTSNVLTLTILPDDPQWDAVQLVDVLRTLDDPRVQTAYVSAKHRVRKIPSETAQDFATSNRVDLTEFVLTQKALNMLDTPEAIRERVLRIKQSPHDQVPDSEAAVALWEESLASSTRPELIAAALARRAEEPDFGVTYGFVALWERFIAQRDNPELFRPARNKAEHYKNDLDYLSKCVEAESGLIPRLEGLVPGKSVEAAAVTSQTIRILKEHREYRQKKQHQ